MDTRIIRREEKKVVERALRYFGVKPNLDKAIQESAELTVAISQYDERRTAGCRNTLISEMADCSVMIDVLKLILGLTDEQFQAERAIKYQGVIERLAMEGESVTPANP